MSKIKSFFSHSKSDLVSGLIVFLIALPLCLGIAQASNAPPFAGIVAGVVGGIVIGFFSKSQLSVSGPAAGLVAIVVGAIEQLGAFEIFLCAVIISGLIQLILGFIKAGSIANYFPSNVIEGMLAGIGLTIILSQIPVAVGYVKDTARVGVEDGENGINGLGILDSLQHIQIGAVTIALIGLGLLILWGTKAMKKFSIIPAGLLVVIVGTLINTLFLNFAPQYALGGNFLVVLPVPESASAFFGEFKLPDFNGFMNPIVWQTGVVIAIVASIETLLCIEATDKLDPQKRFTSGDAELRAQGIGNILSGFIGGLPITSVIVRSSANINAGGRTKLATITHGVLLLVCVATIPFVLNLIPKATLAAILIFTGYRLCRPAVFKHMWKAGMSQFIPFLVTVIAVVSLDLLKGVGLGLAISIFYMLRNNMKIPFYYQRSVYANSEVVKIELSQEVSFLNKASIKNALEKIPVNSTIVLDATNTEYIDYDVITLLKDFQSGQAKDKNINLSLIGFKNSYDIPLEDDNIIPPSEVVENEEDLINRTSGGYKKLIKQLDK